MDKRKKNLLVSFSTGETSAKMAKWLKDNKSNEYNMLFAYANTSREREESLLFGNKCDKEFGLDLVWIEGVYSMTYGEGTTYKVVDYKTAKRNGEVFEEMIKAYGLPNVTYKHCTRELKTNPLKKLADDVFGTNNYEIAIGYRVDEVDRVNKDWKEKRHYYPLITDNPLTKPHVNVFWKNMPFRLNLKGYEGNCKRCLKFTLRKQLTQIKEEREKGEIDKWCEKMEDKYGDYVPPHREEKRKPLEGKLTFFRNNLSHKDLVELSQQNFKTATDDSVIYDRQEMLFGFELDKNGDGGCSESCEPFN
ncbi:hypothetical protein [Christiangramia forsetii]|uniref:Phage-related protein n=2 Tax=Christiangramia forsetii TaxID=411153 RepID=A0M465_CHRFK|nr:hypothetical protein [Christiangramia forsetii]GGG24127.1 hypothetical protein GCM10011532_04200 [Christiangramia forsetii]CAL67410.1 phage-related protein [Christiangramia forsetii KT0803]